MTLHCTIILPGAQILPLLNMQHSHNITTRLPFHLILPLRNSSSDWLDLVFHHHLTILWPQLIIGSGYVELPCIILALIDSVSAQTEVEVTHLTYSIPRNTAIVGAAVSHSMIRLPCDIIFANFWSRVCAHMDLDPAVAELGYKYSFECVGDAPRSLNTDDDLQAAIQRGQDLVRRARSRPVEIMIHNLNPATHAPVTSKKRKVAGIDNGTSATIDFTDELCWLKEHLSCAKHTGRWCFVSPIDGEPKQLDIFIITLWAKKMFLNEATLQQPPDLLQSTTAPNVAAFHPCQVLPRLLVWLLPSTFTSQTCHLVITRDYSGSIHCHWRAPMSLFNMQVVMTSHSSNIPRLALSAFRGHGIYYADAAQNLSHEFLVNEIGMPVGVILRFQEYVTLGVVTRAKKGKGHAKTPAVVDAVSDSDRENKPL
ncbi:hypothetical protein BV22DRAFT_1134975 [Leucogyrophana mollusca]|uniref:Uncharacterized protein n=1 Tax=Leucogyrophana mollusca TaxID=85980 RepID=A0ACB8AXD4_9AGAM|nr:hypothetical protein BV22DRAFT_1134975 [Leucogyrophana mollusca]